LEEGLGSVTFAGNRTGCRNARNSRPSGATLLADIDRQIETQRAGLFQAEEGLKHFDMPHELQERVAANVQRYVETLESLESERKAIDSLLSSPGDRGFRKM
jgi:hypothetical protein